MPIKFSQLIQCPMCDSLTVTAEGIKHGVIYKCQQCGVTEMVEFEDNQVHNLPYFYIAGDNLWLPDCVGKNQKAHPVITEWAFLQEKEDVLDISVTQAIKAILKVYERSIKTVK